MKIDQVKEKPVITDEENEWFNQYQADLLSNDKERYGRYSMKDAAKANEIISKKYRLEYKWYGQKREPRFKKALMFGSYEGYKKMYDAIVGFDDSHASNNYLEGIGWGLGDMGFHGWEAAACKDERETFDAVKHAYEYFLNTLEDALGLESYEEANQLKNNPTGRWVLMDTLGTAIAEDAENNGN